MEVEKFAKEQGFDKVDYIGDWKGKAIYEAYLEEGGVIGLPQYIIDGTEALKFADSEQTFEIMDTLL